MALAAFLVQPQPPALAIREIVVDLHRDDGTDAGKAVDHDADQGAVAQADKPRHFRYRPVRQGDPFGDLDAGEQMPGLILAQDRGLAALDDVLGPAPAWAGLIAKTWPTTSQSNSMQIRCCFIVGRAADRSCTARAPPSKTRSALR